LIWTFPATPLEQVQAFANQYCGPSQKLVVLGSTSAYDKDDGPEEGMAPWIDETSPINTNLPRVQGEEYLRRHYGATVLRVAGIYGPGRNPLEWIKQGRVGPTDKFVNLIHVEDLARVCLLVLEGNHAGETYNVSDGQPRRWADICAQVSKRWGIVSPRQPGPKEFGKRILNHKLTAHLTYTFRHPDLYEALQTLPIRTSHPSLDGSDS
jgi:nucleoside-diphosphate-sugar epimerase